MGIALGLARGADACVQLFLAIQRNAVYLVVIVLTTMALPT
jgi:hypothetical protein